MIGKVTSIFLAFNLLISSLGITTFEHICQKNGVTFSIFVKSGCCSKRVATTKCSDTGCLKHKQINKSGINNKPCCEDRNLYKKLNTSSTDLVKVKTSEIQPIFEFTNSCLTSVIIITSTENQKTLKFEMYDPPPLLVENISVLYQSFIC